jgi:hypothetical protein
MTSEFNSESSPEIGKLIPKEVAKQEIEKYLQDAELGSPRFNAFSDYVDKNYATAFKENNIESQLRLSMIEETIRQRTNGVKGYKAAFENMPDFEGGLRRAIASDLTPEEQWRANGITAGSLNSLKEQLISKKSQ